MSPGRQRQIELLRAWSPQDRLRRGMELTALCCHARDARLRRQHPRASEEELRRLRLREALRTPSPRLP